MKTDDLIAAVAPPEGWIMGSEPSGAIYFAHTSGWYVYATPDWDGDTGMLCIEIDDDQGDYIDTWDLPFPEDERTPERYLALAAPYLAMALDLAKGG